MAGCGGGSARTGIGKVRHLDTRFLWVQEVVRRGLVKTGKIKGIVNTSDILTKPKSLGDSKRLLRLVGIEVGVRREAVRLDRWCDWDVEVRGGRALERTRRLERVFFVQCGMAFVIFAFTFGLVRVF